MKWLLVLLMIAALSPSTRAHAQYGLAPQSGGMPSLGTARPSGELNPRYQEVPLHPELLTSGVTLFGLAWLASIITGAAIIAKWDAGIDNGMDYGSFGSTPVYDGTCHDTLGAISMVPVLGPLLGMIVWGTCTVPTYRWDSVEDEWAQLDRSQGMTSDGGLWGYLIPVAIFQWLGLGLAIPGILGNHTGLVFDSTATAHAPRLTFAAAAPGADVGVSARMDF